ncbi:MAG: hypothetical protein ACI83D_000282 [Planctomycetota bacterium]|jgi:hypothetical protein
MKSKQKTKRAVKKKGGLHRVTWYSKTLSVLTIISVALVGYGYGFVHGLDQDTTVLGPDTLTKYQAAQVLEGVNTFSPQVERLLGRLFQEFSSRFSGAEQGLSQGTPVGDRVIQSMHDLSATRPDVTWRKDEQYRYVVTNALPDHETGEFPNSGNPNTISAQDMEYRMTLTPESLGTATPVQLPGVALNGIPLEPGTAETEAYGGVVWSIEGLGTVNLGMDDSNAHVQPTGLYHYHGVPHTLVAMIEEDTDISNDLIHVAYASDGFPMYVSQSGAHETSYSLRVGDRGDNAPAGDYDGTYTQDFEYVSGSGDLDECNGTELDNIGYAYIISEEFPYINRCVYGIPDPSFQKSPGGQGGFGPGGFPGFGQPGQQPPHRQDQFMRQY